MSMYTSESDGLKGAYSPTVSSHPASAGCSSGGLGPRTRPVNVTLLWGRAVAGGGVGNTVIYATSEIRGLSISRVCQVTDIERAAS